MSDFKIGDVVTRRGWLNEEREEILGVLEDYYLTCEVEADDVDLDDGPILSGQVYLRDKGDLHGGLRLWSKPTPTFLLGQLVDLVDSRGAAGWIILGFYTGRIHAGGVGTRLTDEAEYAVVRGFASYEIRVVLRSEIQERR